MDYLPKMLKTRNGHNFIRSEECFRQLSSFDSILYKCKNCGIYCFYVQNIIYENKSFEFAVKQKWYYDTVKDHSTTWDDSFELQDLSCDEIIIKDIIE